MGTVIAQTIERFLVVEVPEEEVTVDTLGYVVDLSGEEPKVYGPELVQVFLKWGYWRDYKGDEALTDRILDAYDAYRETEEE